MSLKHNIQPFFLSALSLAIFAGLALVPESAFAAAGWQTETVSRLGEIKVGATLIAGGLCVLGLVGWGAWVGITGSFRHQILIQLIIGAILITLAPAAFITLFEFTA